jgi:hypothetical protein
MEDDDKADPPRILDCFVDPLDDDHSVGIVVLTLSDREEPVHFAINRGFAAELIQQLAEFLGGPYSDEDEEGVPPEQAN